MRTLWIIEVAYTPKGGGLLPLCYTVIVGRDYDSTESLVYDVCCYIAGLIEELGYKNVKCHRPSVCITDKFHEFSKVFWYEYKGGDVFEFSKRIFEKEVKPVLPEEYECEKIDVYDIYVLPLPDRYKECFDNIKVADLCWSLNVRSVDVEHKLFKGLLDLYVKKLKEKAVRTFLQEEESFLWKEDCICGYVLVSDDFLFIAQQYSWDGDYRYIYATATRSVVFNNSGMILFGSEPVKPLWMYL